MPESYLTKMLWNGFRKWVSMSPCCPNLTILYTTHIHENYNKTSLFKCISLQRRMHWHKCSCRWRLLRGRVWSFVSLPRDTAQLEAQGEPDWGEASYWLYWNSDTNRNGSDHFIYCVWVCGLRSKKNSICVTVNTYKKSSVLAEWGDEILKRQTIMA